MTPEELAEYQRKEKHRSYMRQYYDKYPEKLKKKRAADLKRIAANREGESKRVCEYYQKNKEKVKRSQLDRARDNKMKAVAVLGSKCMTCGFTHPAALQFHHRDPATKDFNITTKVLGTPKRFSWDMIEAEIAKCDLLCANCHAVHHNKWEIK